MFFFLSKILDVLLTPLGWATVLIVLGLARARRPALRSAMVALGLVVLLFFSLEPVSNALLHALETPPLRTIRPDVTYDVVILLGGVSDARVNATWKERAYNDNNERLLQTFDLLKSGVAKNAIVSGGSDGPATSNEAVVLTRQLVDWGIDPARVVAEGQARNTHENAVYSSAIVRAHGWKSVLIVTSAFHVRRAYGCFVAEGLAVDVLPVDFRSYESPSSGELIPRAEYLAASTNALREWFGRKIYAMRGYSR